AMMLSLVTKRDPQILRTSKQRDGNHDEKAAGSPERERHTGLGSREDPQCSAASNELGAGEEGACGAGADEEEGQGDCDSARADRQSTLGEQIQPQLRSCCRQRERGNGRACRNAAQSLP